MASTPDPIRYECLYDAKAVDLALHRMAYAINAYYGDRPIVALVLLKGGLIPAAWLLPRLNMPVRLEVAQVGRYGYAQSGGVLRGLDTLKVDVCGAEVLLLDDIFDEGVSAFCMSRWCEEQGAASVRVATLVRKIHNRVHDEARLDFYGLTVPDRYVVGCGMDDQDQGRNWPGIYALR